MSYKHCADCHAIFPESEAGEKPRTEWFEAWGHNFPHTFYDPCCPECGSEDIEPADYCPCGEAIRPHYIAKSEKKWTGLCENDEDNLDDIKKEVRALFPKIKEIDKHTVEEYLLSDLWKYTPPELREMMEREG